LSSAPGALTGADPQLAVGGGDGQWIRVLAIEPESVLREAAIEAAAKVEVVKAAS
jgi:hypothetical protein